MTGTRGVAPAELKGDAWKERLPRWMAAFALGGVAATFLAGSLRIAAGFALGAALGMLNYFWLHRAVETLLSQDRARLPKSVLAKFALRYPLAFGAVYLFYRTGWLPFAALLAGLFVPVGGVLVEAAVQIRQGWRFN